MEYFGNIEHFKVIRRQFRLRHERELSNQPSLCYCYYRYASCTNWFINQCNKRCSNRIKAPKRSRTKLSGTSDRQLKVCNRWQGLFVVFCLDFFPRKYTGLFSDIIFVTACKNRSNQSKQKFIPINHFFILYFTVMKNTKKIQIR